LVWLCSEDLLDPTEDRKLS